MPKLKALAATVNSSWLGLAAGSHRLLVCSTERNQYVVVPPVFNEEPITERSVVGINVLDAQEFTSLEQATLAAQHAADAMQRKYIMEGQTSATQH